MFSSRTGWDRAPNELSRALAGRKSPPLYDLTCANPTQVGFEMPSDLRTALADAANARYEPASLGLAASREAVRDYYLQRGCRCEAEDVWLCASTSEAYLYLLATLCDVGDRVAVPRPGYPLLDYIADLVGVELVPYPLVYDGTWHVDLGRLREVADDPKLRAIVCIAPNNPTGAYLHDEELATVESLCASSQRALIVDEVFSDYALRPDPGRIPHVVGTRACLCFALSGLSKVAGLPQLKLSWGVTCGPNELRAEAMARLGLTADAFLSASTPAQRLVAPALRCAPLIQASILQRARANLDGMRERLDGTSVDVLDVEGGWSATVRLPAVGGLDDVGWAVRLLDEDDVLLQPGSLFDLDGVHLVASLLTPPLAFLQGIDRLAKRVERVIASAP